MNLRSLLPLLVAAALLPAAARAATLNVPAQYPTIQAGVNAAVNGDTVLVADGTYRGDGNRDIDFLGKNITVTSQHGAAKTIIDCGGFASADGSGSHRGFYIHSGETAAVISGFTVKNGSKVFASNNENGEGGAILIINSGLTVQDCILFGNTADYGGGIYNSANDGNSLVLLTHCTVSDNTAREVGGGTYSVTIDAPITFASCFVTGNTALNTHRSYGGGGGIYNLSYGPAKITLTDCLISSNIGQLDGGGVSNNNFANGVITLTNCVVFGNIASGNGGGVYNQNYNPSTTSGIVKLINCTIFGNSVQDGTGGGVFNTDYDGKNGVTALSNCIVYSNGSGEIANNGQGTPNTVVANSDIQGGYPGAGNIDADPLFVNAASGNFHLQSGSPCLGAGTGAGAPATDKDGRTRPNPPSIGAYELIAPSVSHILWDNTDGTASVWTVAPDFSYTFHNYGPYPGWTATALADTPDGKTHLLWNHTGDAQVSVWDVDAQNTITFKNYGPFAGWAAAGMSAGPDGRLHLLWNHQPDGQMSLWSLDNGAGTYAHTEYGPFAGWTAKAVATGGDNVTDVVWTDSSGQVSSWQVSSTDGSYVHHEYGPYAGWSAQGLSAGPDGRASLLWNSTGGTASLWSADFRAGTFTFTNYGPYPGWSATQAATGADGAVHLLWSHAPDGQASLWSLGAGSSFTSKNYGPFPGWSAVSLSAGQ